MLVIETIVYSIIGFALCTCALCLGRALYREMGWTFTTVFVAGIVVLIFYATSYLVLYLTNHNVFTYPAIVAAIILSVSIVAKFESSKWY